MLGFAILGSLAKWSRGKVSWFATSEHYIHRLHIFYRSVVGSLSKSRLDQAVAADQHWSVSSFLMSTLRGGRLSYRLTERRQQPAEFTYASQSLASRPIELLVFDKITKDERVYIWEDLLTTILSIQIVATMRRNGNLRYVVRTSCDRGRCVPLVY
jgi:hypothetical protein